MIYLYTGTPGSGKSYHVAKDIYSWLKGGKNVIANFDVNYEIVPKSRFNDKGYFFYRDNFEINVPWLIDFALLCHRRGKKGNIAEGQSWLILDECQLIFNCRSWNDKSRQAWCSFFTQHRKYGYNIVLVTQFDRLVDRQIRSLVEYEVKHRKANNFGFGGMLITLFLVNRPVFAAIEYWYSVKERCGATIMVGRKKYYEMYDSYRLFDTPGSG